MTNRYHYAETVEELQSRLDDGTASQVDLETARALGMEPNRTVWKTSYKQGNQSTLERATAAMQSASRAYDQVVAENKQRAEKAFHGHVGSGAAPRRNPAEPSGANPPQRQDQQHVRAEKPKPNPKPIMINGEDYGPAIEMLTRGPQQVQVQKVAGPGPGHGRGNQAVQRQPARKQFQDEYYLQTARELTQNWPGSWPGPMGYKEGK